MLFAILQKYDFSSKSQQKKEPLKRQAVVCDTAKVRFFKQITTATTENNYKQQLFAILQKYDFSSKSQLDDEDSFLCACCLRYCKSTIFQANHNPTRATFPSVPLFAILQKYDFSSKSQLRLLSSMSD